jgi:hypothetical protein
LKTVYSENLIEHFHEGHETVGLAKLDWTFQTWNDIVNIGVNTPTGGYYYTGIPFKQFFKSMESPHVLPDTNPRFAPLPKGHCIFSEKGVLINNRTLIAIEKLIEKYDNKWVKMIGINCIPTCFWSIEAQTEKGKDLVSDSMF